MSKPTVAVIGGSGAEGSGLAVRWAAAGYPVVIGSRSAEKAASVSAELAALLPAGSATLTGAANAEAAVAGDVVVLSVPYSAQEATLAQIAQACQGKVLITVGVPLKPPKVSVVWHVEGGSASQEAQAQAGPGVRVVAAFQNIAAGHLQDLAWEADGGRRRQRGEADHDGAGARLWLLCSGCRAACECFGVGGLDGRADRHQRTPQGQGRRHSHHRHPARIGLNDWRYRPFIRQLASEAL